MTPCDVTHVPGPSRHRTYRMDTGLPLCPTNPRVADNKLPGPMKLKFRKETYKPKIILNAALVVTI